MDPTKLTNEDGGAKISIDDLIKANVVQKLFAEATIRILQQAKADAEELELYRLREKRKLNLHNPELGEIKNDDDV